MEPLPLETVTAVRRSLGRLVDGIITEIRDENPVYETVFGGPEGIGIRLGIEQAIGAFLDAVARGERPSGEPGEVWRRLGEAEFQAGRSLEALRAAFRTGTRAAWRGAAELAVEAGIEAPVVIALAESIFIYADALASDVVEGYVRIQSDEAGERERRRRRLATLLVDPEAHDPAAIEHAAALARWPVPRRLAAVAIAGDDPRAIARRLDVDALAGADGAGAYLVLTDPALGGRASALTRAVGTASAALGPTVESDAAHRSLAWARAALTLVAQGVIGPKRGLLHATDHLATIILLRDQELARVLLDARLGPLDSARDGERLEQTLSLWLSHQRHTPSIAAELHVHPQTVRYRVARLRELLGDSLDTPDGRFELELALRARKVLRSSRGR